MKKNEIFTFKAPNGVEVTAVVLYIDGNLYQEGSYWVNYLCYAQNRLFYMGQKAVGKPVMEGTCMVGYTPEFIGKLEMEEIVIEYCVIPEYDEMLARYNDIEVAQAETAAGM